MKTDVINHYDSLIDENNDPVFDPQPLKEYMDKWDEKPRRKTGLFQRIVPRRGIFHFFRFL